MKVSRKSWHFKLVDELIYVSYPRESLCIYFWKLVIALLIVGIILPIFGIIIVLTMLSPIINLFIDTQGMEYVGALLDIIVLVSTWHQYRKALKLENNIPEKPSVFAQWMYAKKRKICPFIEFE